MSTRTRYDWILWAQLGCALVVTFHAEYTLALAAGVHEYVALAVPGALDLYVIRALQKHRDVFTAVLVMVAANVASHLVSAGLIPVGWAVYSAVGGTVPLLLWRGHALRQETAGPGAVSTPVLAADTEPSTAYPDEVQVHSPQWAPGYEPGTAYPAWTPGYHLDGCDGVHEYEGPVNCVERASTLSNPAPDHVPAAWTEPDRVMTPSEYAEYEDKWLTSTPDTHSPVPYLKPVPDLPAEYAASTVTEPVLALQPGDHEYVPRAQEYLDKGGRPTIRGLREALGIGQPKAQRLLAYLEANP